ncbi:hypothetical protein ACFOSE_05910 [Streptococcus dentapri]|uniref:Uncharacterized protein n=1 Tax=Streptococcus dentapri TaxID=573564 RepID=A0ABV8D1T9_9STRE
MSNWNLETFDNIYAALAQSAYRNRPGNITYDQLDVAQQQVLDSGKSVEFNFSKDGTFKGQTTEGGGTDLPNGGVVYLQPDQEGIMTDEDTGYQAYYVSDTAEINQDTHQTYFVVRGSDGFGIDTKKLAKERSLGLSGQYGS